MPHSKRQLLPEETCDAPAVSSPPCRFGTVPFVQTLQPDSRGLLA